MGYDISNFPLYPVEQAAEPAHVCVTGATGFVAGAIVERLLRGGHTVHATVRDPSDENKLAALKALPGASDRLKFFRGDLLEEGSFSDAMQGCKYVLHTASPFYHPEKQEDVKPKLLDPALKGTTYCLDAVNATPSVERVVLTSSMAAIFTTKPDGEAQTEADWNESASETNNAYAYSKTIAERRAWEIAKAQDRWQLVAVNPVYVFGPPVGDRADGTSIDIIAKVFDGELPVGSSSRYPSVDVRDVAAAHCLCMLQPNAEGRHIIFEDFYSVNDFGSFILEVFPGQQIAEAKIEDSTRRISNEKVRRELGLNFHPMRRTIQDMCTRLVEIGRLTPRAESDHGKKD